MGLLASPEDREKKEIWLHDPMTHYVRAQSYYRKSIYTQER